MNWQEYQIKAAELFQSAGCIAEVEKKVEGVRGTHNVDVWVTKSVHGLEHRWVVETKYWKKPVEKLHVAALRSIVDDIGADRGILLSSSGFQSGAIALAEKSNITLSSLDEMSESLKDEVLRYTIASLEKKAALVLVALRSLIETKKEKSGSGFYSSSAIKPGVDGNAFEVIGKILMLDDGFRNVRIGKEYYPIIPINPKEKPTGTKDIETFIMHSSKLIAMAELFCVEQSRKVKENA